MSLFLCFLFLSLIGQFSVTLTASDGVCVFREDGDPHVNKGKLGERSVAAVQFFIMALEAGTHELKFTLSTSLTIDVLVKKLRVVVSEDDSAGVVNTSPTNYFMIH